MLIRQDFVVFIDYRNTVNQKGDCVVYSSGKCRGTGFMLRDPEYRPVIRAVSLPGSSNPGSADFYLTWLHVEGLPHGDGGLQRAPDIPFWLSSQRAKGQFSGMAVGKKSLGQLITGLVEPGDRL